MLAIDYSSFNSPMAMGPIQVAQMNKHILVAPSDRYSAIHIASSLHRFIDMTNIIGVHEVRNLTNKMDCSLTTAMADVGSQISFTLIEAIDFFSSRGIDWTDSV